MKMMGYQILYLPYYGTTSSYTTSKTRIDTAWVVHLDDSGALAITNLVV